MSVPIEQTYVQKIGNKNTDKYKLPVGDFILNEWWVGTESKINSSLKVELFWDQHGKSDTKSDWILIDVIYTAKATYQKLIQKNNSFHSNGKSRIIVQQEVLGQNGKRETFVRWKGQIN